MAKKAVYQKKYLAIYISREHFEALLSKPKSIVPIQLAGEVVPNAFVFVQLLLDAQDLLNLAYEAEQKAIDDMNAETRRLHPDYENSEQRRKRIRNGKR